MPDSPSRLVAQDSPQLSRRDWPAFQPPWLLRGGNRQTMAGAYGKTRLAPPPAVRREIQLADGDVLALHDNCPADWTNKRPWVLLAHGLCGCHQSQYMRRMAARLVQRGARCFRLDLRGFGDSLIHGRRTSHAGRHDDIRVALEQAAHWCGQAPGGVIGYSMGGNMTLGMAGQFGLHAPPFLRVVAAVAPPINLSLCAAKMKYGSGAVYGRYFARVLMRGLRDLQHRLPAAFPDRWRRVPRDLWDFDDRFTAPINGFEGAEDYYRQASALPWIANIRVPALVLVAEDDPLIPYDIYQPLREAAAPHVELLATRHGGHLGYVGRRGVDPDERWMDWRLLDWLEQHLGPWPVPAR